MTTIKLKLVNQSQATDNPVIAITCTDPSSGEPVVAWRLVRNIGPGSMYPFTYSPGMEIAASDSDGNYTPKQPAEPGTLFVMTRTGSGDQLVRDSQTLQPQMIGVRNTLPNGPVTAFIYRDNRVCAQSAVYQNAQAMFSLRPEIFIGRATNVQEGPVSTTVEFTGDLARFDVRGLNNATIVMRGGGSEPLTFTLE